MSMRQLRHLQNIVDRPVNRGKNEVQRDYGDSENF